MVAGIAFLISQQAVPQPAFKFDPFGDEDLLSSSFIYDSVRNDERSTNGFTFSPLGTDDALLRSFNFGSYTDVIDFATNPRPAPKAELELHHPKPLRVAAHMEALQRFEETARNAEYGRRVSSPTPVFDSPSKLPTASPRKANPHALPPTESSTLPMEQRVIGPPKRSQGKGNAVEPHSPAHAAPFSKATTFQTTGPSAPQRNVLTPLTSGLAKARALGNICFYPPSPPATKPVTMRESGGLACLSPGFLDHFPEHAKKQAAWGRAPRPEDMPRPTFILRKAPATNVEHLPSPIPTIPLQYTGGSHNEAERHSEVEKRAEEDALEDDVLSYVSSFLDIEDEEEDSHQAVFLFDQESDTSDDDDDNGYYTASEYSGYEADDDSFGDDEVSVPPLSQYPSPALSPASHPSPYSSAGSLAYTTSTSPAASMLSTSSGASNAQATVATANIKMTNPASQLHWTVGMPGDAVTFLIAAERALQRQARVQM